MRGELTKTFMMISNWKNPFGLHGLFQRTRVDDPGLANIIQWPSPDHHWNTEFTLDVFVYVYLLTPLFLINKFLEPCQ